MVDVEAVVTGFLRNDPAVTAICGQRIYTDLPNQRTYPLLHVWRSGGGYVINRPQWLDRAELTVSAYGSTRKQAQELLAVTLADLATSLPGQHPQGCVTTTRAEVQLYDPDPDSPDPDGHARPRFTATVSVYIHP